MTGTKWSLTGVDTEEHSVYLVTHIETGDCFGVVLISGQNAARLEGKGEHETFQELLFYQYWRHKEEASSYIKPLK